MIFIAFTAALPTFSEFKHNLSSESNFLKKLTPFPQISKQTPGIYITVADFGNREILEAAWKECSVTSC